MKILYFEDIINELLWYSFKKDIQFTEYTADYWVDIKKVKHFS